MTAFSVSRASKVAQEPRANPWFRGDAGSPLPGAEPTGPSSAAGLLGCPSPRYRGTATAARSRLLRRCWRGRSRGGVQPRVCLGVTLLSILTPRVAGAVGDRETRAPQARSLGFAVAIGPVTAASAARRGARASRRPAQGWKRKSPALAISCALVTPSTLIESLLSRWITALPSSAVVVWWNTAAKLTKSECGRLM